jgi:glyoxylase-like metal-dependent hydrolase (beta-lactamase superfamily II)
MADREVFEVFAVRYAHNAKRNRRDNFMMPLVGETDPHLVPMPLDYFVWVVKSDKRTYVIDTGFGEAASKERGTPLLRTPAEGLATIGIDAAKVTDVIISHMHYDHAGGVGAFTNATFHLQDVEMAYATGRHMCFEPTRRPFDIEDAVLMVRKVYGGKVKFHDGDAELAPGLSLHRIGGHSAGLMCVRVWTKRGWVVIASDCAHFYENIRQHKPFVICFDLGAMLNGFNTMEMLADSPDHIIPGHDPLVLKYYPPVSEQLRGIVHRLDVAPTVG